jgi:Fanconi-associated nuclease 1
MDRFIQRSKPNATQAQPALVKPNPAQTSNEPPRKRARLDEIKDSDDEDGDSTPASVNEYDENDRDLSDLKERTTDGPPDAEADDDGRSRPAHQTAFESSLPAVATDKEAIEEYEAMRASQASQEAADSASARIDNRRWIRGKSSIYVDAFNLALDTVLEDEAHLFDAKEKRIFEEWRGLSYEAQYL